MEPPMVPTVRKMHRRPPARVAASLAPAARHLGRRTAHRGETQPLMEPIRAAARNGATTSAQPRPTAVAGGLSHARWAATGPARLLLQARMRPNRRTPKAAQAQYPPSRTEPTSPH